MEVVAQAVLAELTPFSNRATVVGLVGELGVGKTTLTQAIGKALGISDSLISPTFVIAKFYETTAPVPWRRLAHIDAYRIEEGNELDPLGWDALLRDPQTLVIVEWPDRIKGRLPAETSLYELSHVPRGRHIKHRSSL